MDVRDRRSDPNALRAVANSPEVQRAAAELAKAIQRDARTLAPRNSGNLRRHIEIEETIDPETGIEGYAVGWGDKAFYGPFVENGGDENRKPRPHLVPAALKNGAGGR